MAKSPSKKNDETQIVEDLINDIDYDRQRLSSFFDKILQVEDTHMIAEAVARIADSLTKQSALRVATIKARSKLPPEEGDETESTYDQIGRPFAPDEEEGSN